MSYQDRAKAIPIDGLYPDLAAMVRELLGWTGYRPWMSTREASLKTNVSASTIGHMARGDRPSGKNLRAFAEGMGADVTALFQVADYLPRGSEESL